MANPFALGTQARAVADAAAALAVADGRLVQEELAAARRSFVQGAVLAAVALALLLAGIGAASVATVLGLVALGLSLGVAVLLSCVLFLALATLSGALALRLWSSRRLLPVHTLAALRRIPETLSSKEVHDA
jgi:hypothetical protein